LGRSSGWPDARPLAAEIHPSLLGIGLELWDGRERLGVIEDFELYVNDDPTGTLTDIESANGGLLSVVGVLNDRSNNRQIPAWQANFDTGGRITAQRDLLVRRGYGSPEFLANLFEQSPPTIYFLDGTTTLGALLYDSRVSTTTFDLRLLMGIAWPSVDITAETARTARTRGPAVRSIHECLAEYLRDTPRRGTHRWILYNDGAGEIADYVVVEELASGEVQLSLWHAKAAHGTAPGVRVKDFQEVVSQGLRSRRWFPSTTLWEELAARLNGVSSPRAVLVDGSDDEGILRQRLAQPTPAGANDAEPSWRRAFPVVRGRIGIAQPGLSASELRRQLESAEIPAGAQSLRELFSVLADMALSDGAELELLVSH